jgi:hypothetical protein
VGKAFFNTLLDLSKITMGIRSTILTTLPLEVRKELEKRLVEKGFSGYIELTQWLNGLGYRISKGALNRYGIQFEQRHTVRAAAQAQARELAEAAAGDEVIATEALVRLVQERLFSILIESEKPADAIDLARLANIINNLSRTTITHRRWIAESQERLARLQRAAAGEVATMERAGGLSPAAAEAIRAILLSIDPFDPTSPPPDASPSTDS